MITQSRQCAPIPDCGFVGRFGVRVHLFTAARKLYGTDPDRASDMDTQHVFSAKQPVRLTTAGRDLQTPYGRYSEGRSVLPVYAR
jgi:hypothetical protein